jgi:hypothetical protein
MKKWFEIDFEPGDIVYLKTDRDQYERMVTGYCIRQAGITYELSFGSTTSWHYGFEISVEKEIKIPKFQE